MRVATVVEQLVLDRRNVAAGAVQPVPVEQSTQPGAARRTRPSVAAASAIVGFVVLSRARMNLRWRYRLDAPGTAAGPEREARPGGRAILEGRRTRVTDRLEQRIVELYATGWSSRLVANELGVAKATVLRVLKAAGVGVRPRVARY